MFGGNDDGFTLQNDCRPKRPVEPEHSTWVNPDGIDFVMKDGVAKMVNAKRKQLNLFDGLDCAPGQLDLKFTDLLDESDPMGFNKHFLRKGHGVWTIGDPVSYVRGEDRSDYRHLCVIYDDGRFHMDKDKSRKWCVELRRYVYTYRTVATGWGKSRKVERKLFTENHDHERWFATREEACEFAKKLLAIFERVKQRRSEGET